MSPVREDVAESWEDALRLLYDGSWDRDLLRHRSRFAFRGEARADTPLSTTLMRLGGDFVHVEPHLLRNFRKYARTDFADAGLSDWAWLTLGQHHGLPTRLLDWTFSPMVALHFVTCDLARVGEDGAVWCVDFGAVHDRLLPRRLARARKAGRADVFTVAMLDRVAATLDAFDALSGEPFAIFFEPPSLDERIVNQYALFSVLSRPDVAFDAWVRAHPELCRRVVIRASAKWEIRDKLDQANFTERVLFPGLDGLAAWLERHYSPR